MGTPVPPPPIDYGDDCECCTPPLGELWEPGKTPLFMYVYFAGLQPCPGAPHSPPNGKTFKLTQKEGYPCVWESMGSVWRVYFVTNAPEYFCRLTLQDVPGANYYFDDYGPGCPPETYVFHNDIAACVPPDVAKGGVAVIHWMDIVLRLVTAMSLPSASKLMHELFVTDEDKIVHKFCMPKYSMNIKMLLNP